MKHVCIFKRSKTYYKISDKSHRRISLSTIISVYMGKFLLRSHICNQVTSINFKRNQINKAHVITSRINNIFKQMLGKKLLKDLTIPAN